MHHVLMERCQRYMNKCNEQEIIIKDNVALQELKAMNITFFFQKWKWRATFKKLV